MKLPKQLEREGIEPEVRRALESERIALHGASEIYIPLLKLTPELRTNIFHAKSLGDLIIGLRSDCQTLVRFTPSGSVSERTGTA